MSRIILPKLDEGPGTNTTIRVPKKLLDKVDAIAKESGWSRNEVIVQFIRWALDEHLREETDPNPDNEQAFAEAQRRADAAESNGTPRLKRPTR